MTDAPLRSPDAFLQDSSVRSSWAAHQASRGTTLRSFESPSLDNRAPHGTDVAEWGSSGTASTSWSLAQCWDELGRDSQHEAVVDQARADQVEVKSGSSAKTDPRCSCAQRRGNPQHDSHRWPLRHRIPSRRGWVVKPRFRACGEFVVIQARPVRRRRARGRVAWTDAAPSPRTPRTAGRSRTARSCWLRR
jgi:hypothetical protein